jgi:hypothetical protein
VTDNSTGHCKILLNPGPLRVPDKSMFTVRGFVIAKDEVRMPSGHVMRRQRY